MAESDDDAPVGTPIVGAEADPVEVHHHPHPVHTWKEFLREIGIIMIGVLLALGAEQVAEAFHWRHEVEVEREALRTEARENLSAAAYRMSLQPCIDARLAQIAEVFDRHTQGKPLGLLRPVSRAPLWTGSTGSWDIAVSGQALGHMPRDEKLAFSEAFQTYKVWARLRDQEDEDWRRLALLDHPAMLNESDWSTLHAAWGDLVGTSNRMKSITSDIFRNDSLGQHAEKNPDVETALQDAFCAPLT